MGAYRNFVSWERTKQTPRPVQFPSYPSGKASDGQSCWGCSRYIRSRARDHCDLVARPHRTQPTFGMSALRQKRSVGIRLGEPDCSVAIDNTLAKGRRVWRAGGNGLPLRASSATASHEKASVVFSLAEYQSAGCPVLLGHDTRPAWARRPLARPGFGPELECRRRQLGVRRIVDV